MTNLRRKWTAAGASGIAFTFGLLAAAEGSRTGSHFFVTPAAAELTGKGLAAAPPSDTASFEKVPVPRLRFQANIASATAEPWIDSNGSRFERGVKKAFYERLAPGSAALAAAEAFTYGVDAVLDPAPADVAALSQMLEFLRANDRPRLPVIANIAVVDDKSPAIPEVLNLLTRRNLLYRVVPAADAKADLVVKLGSRDFPVEATRNPSEFAALVRQKLTDEKRLVRLFGTSTTTAHLTGDGRQARLYLLSYGRTRNASNTRVRVLGRYKTAEFAGFGNPAGSALTDFENTSDATEFLLPEYSTIAIIDLKKN